MESPLRSRHLIFRKDTMHEGRETPLESQVASWLVVAAQKNLMQKKLVHPEGVDSLGGGRQLVPWQVGTSRT